MFNKDIQRMTMLAFKRSNSRVTQEQNVGRGTRQNALS